MKSSINGKIEEKKDFQQLKINMTEKLNKKMQKWFQSNKIVCKSRCRKK